MIFRARTKLLTACLLALACTLPAAAEAATTGGTSAPSASSSSSSAAKPQSAPKKATIRNGLAVAPAGAPAKVVAIIKAANRIARKPYRMGGGHGRFEDSAYDCSGSVSYALHGAKLLSSPLDSSSLMSWGSSGTGHWVTVYSNPDHAFLVVAGLRFDTGWRDRASMRGAAPGSGPRWGRTRPTTGFRARHPAHL